LRLFSCSGCGFYLFVFWLSWMCLNWKIMLILLCVGLVNSCVFVIVMLGILLIVSRWLGWFVNILWCIFWMYLWMCGLLM